MKNKTLKMLKPGYRNKSMLFECRLLHESCMILVILIHKGMCSGLFRKQGASWERVRVSDHIIVSEKSK